MLYNWRSLAVKWQIRRNIYTIVMGQPNRTEPNKLLCSPLALCSVLCGPYWRRWMCNFAISNIWIIVRVCVFLFLALDSSECGRKKTGNLCHSAKILPPFHFISLQILWRQEKGAKIVLFAHFFHSQTYIRLSFARWESFEIVRNSHLPDYTLINYPRTGGKKRSWLSLLDCLLVFATLEIAIQYS